MVAKRDDEHVGLRFTRQLMPDSYWENLKEIFHAALALAPPDRAAYLDQASNGDISLRRAVESLLKSHEETGNFVDAPAYKAAAEMLVDGVDLKAGKNIAHYRIIRLIGEGGMGKVYLAEDAKLHRRISLKFLSTNFTQDRERLRRFEQEARAASALNHPNILTIHEIGEVDSHRFIAAEFIEGQTLREHLQAGIEIQDAIEIAIQIASALVAAHRVNIVHRDIKPENIMIRRDDGLVKVLDFGLAKMSAPPPGGKMSEPPEAVGGLNVDIEAPTQLKTGPGVVMGTVAYMSPEQVRGLEVDARTDIWSLGVVLYEMVTGRTPFTGETTSHVAVAILEDEPVPVSRLAPNAPSELQRIVRKSLAKDREERYQSARDLLIDLKSLKQEFEGTARLDRSAPAELSDERNPVVARVTGGTADDTPKRIGGFQAAHSTPSIGQSIRKFFLAAGVLVCFMLIALAAWYFVRPWVNERQHGDLPITGPAFIASPLTTDPGFEGMPSLSPDGNYVAFIAGGGEQQKDFDLYVKQIGTGGQPLRLTSGPAVEEFPAWSPDGRSIAFVRPKGQRLEVFLIPPLGGPERKVAETIPSRSSGELDWNANYLSWSPDSKYLVMADQASPEEPFSLFVFSVTTGERRRLTTPPAAASADGDPAISPDGHVLAFVRVISDGNPQLHLLPLSEDYGPAGEARRLDLPQSFITGPAWTSDGQEIIYSASQPWGTGETRLWRVPMSGSAKPQPLASVGENGSHASISRQGSRLVYADWKLDTDIWRVEVSRGKPAGPGVKLIASTHLDDSPQYSLDGSRIAFTSDRSGHSEIWVCNSDGSSPVQLTSLGGSAGSPRWFPDGHRLVFDLLKEGHADSYSIDADSRIPARLTNDLSDNVTPSVSHDGKWIYFASKRTGRMEIWRLPVEGGEAVQVTHNGGVEPIESVDGKVIYYAKVVGETDVWKVPVSGGDETRVLGPVWVFWFTVVAEGIYFIDGGNQAYAASSRENSLKFYRFATATTEKVADIKLNPNGGLSVSPDGRYALMALGDWEVCDLKLVENFR